MLRCCGKWEDCGKGWIVKNELAESKANNVAHDDCNKNKTILMNLELT